MTYNSVTDYGLLSRILSLLVKEKKRNFKGPIRFARLNQTTHAIVLTTTNFRGGFYSWTESSECTTPRAHLGEHWLYLTAPCRHSSLISFVLAFACNKTFKPITLSLLVFRCFYKNPPVNFAVSLSPFVYVRVRNRKLFERIFMKFSVAACFTKSCRHTPVLIKIGQKQRALQTC
jgi:hypothetical protein